MDSLTDSRHVTRLEIVDSGRRRRWPEEKEIADRRGELFGSAVAVAHQLGIGFTWQHGSSRSDKIVRVHVPEMATQVPEHIFCLAGKHYKLVELFFETPQAIKHMTA
jgi:hypothetical protein